MDAQPLPGVQHICRHHRVTPSDIETFFATLKAANPNPQTELEFASVFELLAAVLLSAQATDVGVNKATRRLFAVANTPQKILNLGLPGLEGYIKTIGLPYSTGVPGGCPPLAHLAWALCVPSPQTQLPAMWRTLGLRVYTQVSRALIALFTPFPPRSRRCGRTFSLFTIR
jgi:hypothetical protein